MKHFKRLMVVLCAGVLMITFAGCRKAKYDRVLFRSGLEEYVTLGEYEGITIDTSSEEYLTFYDAEVLRDVKTYELYERHDSGVIELNDIANINYFGAIDGEIIEEGYAEDEDLEIGSHSFLDDFEQGLIGKAIGDTVYLDVTFSEDYGVDALDGKAAVFTVKINFSNKPRDPESSYADVGFDTAEEYKADLTDRAVRAYLFNAVSTNSAIVAEYPADDAALICDAYLNMRDIEYQQRYGTDLETVISYTGMSSEEYRGEIMANIIYPMMDEQMIYYAVLDDAKLGLTKKDLKKRFAAYLEQLGDDTVTQKDVAEFYGKYYLESMTVSKKVSDYLYEKAVIR